MCIACNAETHRAHPLNECAAIDGAYHIVCHHRSSRPPPRPPHARAARSADGPAEPVGAPA
jgi:hypothetical protein